jgi:hypothetical protein
MEHYNFLFPILIRIVVLVAVPTGHFLFHKYVHLGIHLSSHKLHMLGRLTTKFKWLPDIIMIGALIALHFFTEGKEEHEE